MKKVFILACFVLFTSFFFIVLYTQGSFAAASLNKKVLLVVYDPILKNGQKLHQARNWQDPILLTSQIISSLQNSSGNFLNYQTEIAERNEWPPLIDGYRYNEEDYNTCLDSGFTKCHIPVDVSYARIWQDLNLCSRISSKEVDEIFLYGPAQAGWDEFAFKIPEDKMPYDTPTNYWLYQGRKKDIPDCNGKTVFVMGFIYERGLAEALESYGHRAESALALTIGRGYWDGCMGTSDFDRYTCINKDVSTLTPVQVAGCGNSHFPPNGLSDYNDTNTAFVPNACSSWNNYPFTAETVNNQNCLTWGCSRLTFLQWWMNHFPKLDGVTANGNLRNWWKYIADFDNAVKEAKPSSATLNFSIKLQGINTKGQNKNVKLTLKNSQTFENIGLTSDASGIYSGTINNVTPGTYEVLLKESIHLQKNFGPVTFLANQTIIKDWTASILKAGDLNNDGIIEGTDLSIVLGKVRQYNFNPIPSGIDEPADLNDDHYVEGTDLSLLLSNVFQQDEQ